MSEDSHHLGEAMRLEDVEELKCLHLKSKTSVNQKQHLTMLNGRIVTQLR